MPWLPEGLRKRDRLEETTDKVQLVRDIWIKVRLVLTHVAGLAGLVSTMNTELAALRARVEGFAIEVAALRKAGDERWEQLKTWIEDE